MHTVQLVAQVAVSIIFLLCWVWGSLALYVAGPEPVWWKYILLGGFIVSFPVILFLGLVFWQKIGLLSIILSIFMIWWVSLKATNEKDWAPEVARIPYAEVEDGVLIVHNVRNFSYKTRAEFTERWETRRYNLEQLQTLDIFLSYWKSPHIAHVIMSWGFGDGEYLAISIETRKDKTQAYSELKGFFKQYMLAYVAADERDLIKLRTNFRKEQVYGYRIRNIPVEYKRYLLDSYIRHMNKLVDKPEFYHALLQNCTSGISSHYKTFMPNTSWIDWRLIADGHLDKLLYELGLIRTDLPFDELKVKSRIDLRMQEYEGEDYSTRLRQDSVWEALTQNNTTEARDIIMEEL